MEIFARFECLESRHRCFSGSCSNVIIQCSTSQLFFKSCRIWVSFQFNVISSHFGNGTFENLPILAAGLMFGPLVGGAVGLSADVISYLLSRQVYPINPLVTLGAMAVGLVCGLVSRYVITHPGKLRIILSCVLAHVVGSMIIKPLGLYQFYGVAVLWRIPLYLAIAPVEIALLCLVYRNRTVRTFIDSHTGGKHEHQRGH